MAQMNLPPGAKLVSGNFPGTELPPGAKLVSGAFDTSKLPPGATLASDPASPTYAATAYAPEGSATGRFFHNFAEEINPVPGLEQLVRHPIDTAENLVKAQGNQFEDAWHDLHDTREMPGLASRLSSAFGHTVAGLLPVVGPAAAAVGEQIGSGDIAGGVGSGLGLIGSMSAPTLMRGGVRTIGRLIAKPASPIAESALGIRGAQRSYGATPGRAILEETKGTNPEEIARQGQARVDALNAELEQRARQSHKPASLVPARQIGRRAIGGAKAANSASAPREMQPMLDQLTIPREGFTGATEYPSGAQTPISFQQQPTGIVGLNGQPVSRLQLVRGTAPKPVVAAAQEPIDLLGMKRQFGKDFIDNWNSNNSRQALGTGKEMYHAMDNELDRTVPGASGLDQRIQSLIPVINRSELVARGGTGLERALARIARPTGALAAGLTGFIEGAKRGIPAALLGGAAGLAAPEIISSPRFQLGAARALYGTGNRIARLAPAGNALGQALRAGSLLRIPATGSANQ